MTLLALKAMGSGIAQLLNKEGVLRVDLRAPNRDEHIGLEKDLEDGVDGFILDINLSDQVGADGKRFVGTGAGLAQDLRLQQALFPDSGQRPRPVVRLCAEQVFQHYLQGDNSTADIFDLGFSKETIADIATEARAQIASLPTYTGILLKCRERRHPQTRPPILLA